MSLLEASEKLKLEKLGNDVNLYSYILLKGIRVLRAKLQNEADYVELRRELLVEVSRVSLEVLQQLLGEINGSLKEVVEGLKADGYNVKECTIRTVSRFVGGVGEPAGQIPFEVGLFLDPILGVPYIPGSTLKGAFRHALYEIAEREGYDPKRADELANTLFGSPKGAGLVGITDAYPISADERLLEPDVITPHYPGAKNELDAQPKPVTFLTVAPGVEFKFYIYYKEKAINYVFQGDLNEEIKRSRDPLSVMKIVDKAVFYALARGVGAKTSVGYSEFELTSYKDA